VRVDAAVFAYTGSTSLSGDSLTRGISMPNTLRILFMALSMAVCLHPADAADDDAQAAIRRALLQWTADFNARRADKVCDLFAPDLKADICTAPEQTYQIVCDRLKRVLSDNAHSYAYGLDIKEILEFGDIAVVRLTWTLTIASGAEALTKSVEEGIDVFSRQPDGTWKSMRFMAYS
jgi:ketosteroid isomerase-like protein